MYQLDYLCTTLEVLTRIDRRNKFVVEFMFRLVNCTKNIRNKPLRINLTSIPVYHFNNSINNLNQTGFQSQNLNSGNKFLVRGNEFSIRGKEFRLSGNEFRMRGNKLRMRGNKFPMIGNEFWLRGSKFRLRGNQFRIRGTQFLIKGIEFRISGKQFGGGGNNHFSTGDDFSFNIYQPNNKVSNYKP